jgi:HK97 family phage major capsid protein
MFTQEDVDFVRSTLEDIAAQHDGVEFPEDVQTRWDEGVAFVADAQRLSEMQVARAEQLEAARQFVPHAIAPGGPVSAPNVNLNRGDVFDLSDVSMLTRGSDLRARALTGIEQISRSGVSDTALSAATETLERCDTKDGKVALRYLLTGSDSYRSAWGKMLNGQSYALTGQESDAIARAASLTDAAGGFAVPFLLDPTVILTNDGTANPFRQLGRTVRGTSDTWNGISSAGVTASWDAETVEVSDDAPTLAQPSIAAHKAAAFVPFSIEISQDWAGMESEIAQLFVDAKDRLEGAAFATGSGSGQPTGIVTAIVAAGSPNLIASITGDTFAIGDVYATIEALGPRYRPNASWVANYNILNDIRGFGTANNVHSFSVDLTAEGIPAVLGKPVYEASDMDGVINAGAHNYVLLVGDFSNYVIFDRIGMSVELVPHLFSTGNNRPSGQRGFYAHWRVGADSVNDDAFTLLNVT